MIEEFSLGFSFTFSLENNNDDNYKKIKKIKKIFIYLYI